MRIDVIRIEGFRGIEELEITLNPKFNLLIGENGSGKTAILEAIAVGMGAFFSGMPGVSSRHIRSEDIRYFKIIEGSYEFAQATRVEVLKGEVNAKKISWYKERSGITGSNKLGNVVVNKSISSSLTKRRKSIPLAIHGALIKHESETINDAIRDSKRMSLIDLPVLAYYSTARLWKEGRENKKDEENQESIIKNLPSRYRGYKDALEIKSTFKIMLEWFKSKFLDQAVNKSSTFQLDCVKNTIINNIPGATDVKWIFDDDQIQTLYICFVNGDETPFHFLSDGYRNLLAIFADLAYRCVTLNPHFGTDANLKTEGMVLIDELDLHLHPAWQKKIVQQLKDTFPRVQFVATTHSPFIIQEMEEGELYRISDNGKISIGGGSEYSLSDVAEFLQNVKDPDWSIHKLQMYNAAKEYFDLLNQLKPGAPGEKINDIRERLNVLGKPYSDNVAYTAFLEQKRFLAEQNLIS